MNTKKIIITVFLIIFLQGSAFAQKTTVEKFQRGADIYFKITDRLELNFTQQRKAFGIKMEEMVKLAPLMNEISTNEVRLNELLTDNKKDNCDEIKKLSDNIELQKEISRKKN